MRDESNQLNLEPCPSDIILPSQYFSAMGSSGLCSEQRLMLAVLVEAINVVQGWRGVGGAYKRRAFAEAAHWVNTCGTGDPFSFDSICDALGVDSAILRRRMSGLTKGHASAARITGGHLRRKETGRAQHLTPKRVRRRCTQVPAARCGFFSGVSSAPPPPPKAPQDGCAL
jgi:hypothetical protein